MSPAGLSPREAAFVTGLPEKTINQAIDRAEVQTLPTRRIEDRERTLAFPELVYLRLRGEVGELLSPEGKRKLVDIALALALKPKVLLMDEPTSALDPARRGALGETLRGLARQGRGLLIATHDVDFARAHADRVVVLHEGVLVEDGPAAEVLTRPAHPATRELLLHEAEPG